MSAWRQWGSLGGYTCTQRPGLGQITNQRLNEMLKSELRLVPHIDVYTAVPPDFECNGLPVHGSAGLELGLIKKYDLPWNVRSAR
ncbi:hypothetical protein GGD63_001912 [Bradyrhizobium sp. cir1]|uniref:hypothetical protein n=1 Tax=Bradyrhizobium sp. cir1 TaxID=1445730 RepID=UPI001606CAF9|nr:hypothetical protein [Bradyrhizobium sp. cir1]MBB4369124.1 hypothetical protein [Bradyrhizobium sp. cir1]